MNGTVLQVSASDTVRCVGEANDLKAKTVFHYPRSPRPLRGSQDAPPVRRDYDDYVARVRRWV